MPFSLGSMQSHSEVASFGRVRIKLSVRRQTARAQDPVTQVGQMFLFGDLAQKSQVEPRVMLSDPANIADRKSSAACSSNSLSDCCGDWSYDPKQ